MERNNEDERRGLIERGEETMNETARKARESLCV